MSGDNYLFKLLMWGLILYDYLSISVKFGNFIILNTYCVICLSTHWFFLIDWCFHYNGWLSDWSCDWLIVWLTDWLIDWLVDLLNDCCDLSPCSWASRVCLRATAWRHCPSTPQSWQAWSASSSQTSWRQRTSMTSSRWPSTGASDKLILNLTLWIYEHVVGFLELIVARKGKHFLAFTLFLRVF